jgi:hypothetical protein
VTSETSKGGSQKKSQSVEAKVSVKSDELLKDVTVKEKWLNRGKCQLWTLAVVAKDSVIANRNFKNMSALYARSQRSWVQAKEALELLAKGRALLPEIKFEYIHEQNDARQWAELFDKAMEKARSELGKKKNVIMVVLKRSARTDESVDLPATIVQKLAGGVAALKPIWADMSAEPCGSTEGCLEKARGTSENVLIVSCWGAAKQSNFGSFKGTLTVEISQYDLKLNAKVGKPQHFISEITSAFSKDDLDWDMAAEKLINSKKLDYLKE